MLADGGRAQRRRSRGACLAVAAGTLLGVIATLMLETLGVKWALFTIAGLILCLPAFILPDAKLYWFGLSLVLFLILGGRGKSLTRDFVDPYTIIDTLGVPPGAVTLSLLPSDVVLLGLTAVWFLRVVMRKDEVYLPKAVYLVMAYLLWAGTSSLLKAPSLYLSAVEFAQQCKYFLLYVYTMNAITSKRFARGLIAILMLCLALQGMETIVSTRLSFEYSGSVLTTPLLRHEQFELPQVITEVFEGEEGGARRALGTFGPMATALYLHSLTPLAFTLLLTAQTRRRKLLYLFLLVLGVAATYLTYSRAGLAGLLTGLGAVLWLGRRRALVSKRQMVAAACIGTVLLVAASPILVRYFGSRPGAVTARAALYEKAGRMIVGDPIFGVGLNNSTMVKKEFVDASDAEASSPIHDHYLVLAAETGLVGFALYMAAFLLAGVEAVRRSRSGDREIAAWSVAWFGSYLAVAVHVLADPMYFSGATMMWFCMGLIFAMRRIDTAPVPPEPETTNGLRAPRALARQYGDGR